MIEKTCPVCGKSFSHKPSAPRTYCGRECAAISCRADKGQTSKHLSAGDYRAVHVYQEGARYRGLAWELSHDECLRLLNGRCYLCGKHGPGGIDRLDSDQGYIMGNVASCCTDCNLLKGSWHITPFLDQIKLIHDHSTAQNFYRWREETS